MARGMADRSLAFAFATSVFGGTLSEMRRELPISMNLAVSARALREARGRETHNAIQCALQHIQRRR
jgi:hypothetical protein